MSCGSEINDGSSSSSNCATTKTMKRTTKSQTWVSLETVMLQNQVSQIQQTKHDLRKDLRELQAQTSQLSELIQEQERDRQHEQEQERRRCQAVASEKLKSPPVAGPHKAGEPASSATKSNILKNDDVSEMQAFSTMEGRKEDQAFRQELNSHVNNGSILRWEVSSPAVLLGLHQSLFHAAATKQAHAGETAGTIAAYAATSETRVATAVAKNNRNKDPKWFSKRSYGFVTIPSVDEVSNNNSSHNQEQEEMECGDDDDTDTSNVNRRRAPVVADSGRLLVSPETLQLEDDTTPTALEKSPAAVPPPLKPACLPCIGSPEDVDDSGGGGNSNNKKTFLPQPRQPENDRDLFRRPCEVPSPNAFGEQQQPTHYETPPPPRRCGENKKRYECLYEEAASAAEAADQNSTAAATNKTPDAGRRHNHSKQRGSRVRVHRRSYPPSAKKWRRMRDHRLQSIEIL